MALVFPLNPQIGNTYQSGSSNTYEWTGTYWKIKNVINFNQFSASIVDRINAATNEQDLSYLATTGSNFYYGDQNISGSLNLFNEDSNYAVITVEPTIQNGGFIYDNWSRDLLIGAEGRDITLVQFGDSTFTQLSLSSGSVEITGSILVSGSIIPTTGNGTYTSSFSLGSATNAWKDLYISHGSIIFVDAVTQETSSFSISNQPGLAGTVQYSAGITASYYLGDGANLTNLPSTTNWNKDKEYILRSTEQLTFSGDYILENSWLLIEGSHPNSIGDWVNVTQNSVSGLITKTSDNTYRIDGPADNSGISGWLFIKKYFDAATTLSIGYDWTSTDGSNDWPMYEVNPTEQTGEMDNTNRLIDANTSHESGSWTINVPANNWLAIGVYSNDCEAGSGSLNLTLPYTTFGEELEYSPNKYFKKEGSIFIGGNLLVKDSVITNNGKISVGGEVILIGNSVIAGTGTII